MPKHGLELCLSSKNAVCVGPCVYARASTYGVHLCVTVDVWRREKPHLLQA